MFQNPNPYPELKPSCGYTPACQHPCPMISMPGRLQRPSQPRMYASLNSTKSLNNKICFKKFFVLYNQVNNHLLKQLKNSSYSLIHNNMQCRSFLQCLQKMTPYWPTIVLSNKMYTGLPLVIQSVYLPIIGYLYSMTQFFIGTIKSFKRSEAFYSTYTKLGPTGLPLVN